MKNDLILASRIQSAFLPIQDSIEYISTLYLSLDKVGGDFYDFIQFTDKNKIGIFISDVSGHGVASALITAILKATIQEFPINIKENPKVKSAFSRKKEKAQNFL
ncbi:MAG: hypothetical protein SFU98_13990 [Leptospiraceae bacterium]|nr:hypothetical protein [Leptospiraceae bacterium]